MRCLAEFFLDSDLCLPTDAPALTLTHPQRCFTVILSNAKHDPELPRAVLSAQLIFDAQSFENIHEVASAKMAECMNYLAFTTSTKFSVVLLRRIIDWTPGIVQREARIYSEAPEWKAAEAALEPKFMDTVQRLIAMASHEEQQAAMRWYRRAIQTESLEDQFSYFWFALEIAAQTLKGSERVASKCPRCQSPLYCETCGDHPLHKKYPGQAIKAIIERVLPEGADEAFNAVNPSHADARRTPCIHHR